MDYFFIAFESFQHSILTEGIITLFEMNKNYFGSIGSIAIVSDMVLLKDVIERIIRNYMKCNHSLTNAATFLNKVYIQKNK